MPDVQPDATPPARPERRAAGTAGAGAAPVAATGGHGPDLAGHPLPGERTSSLLVAVATLVAVGLLVLTGFAGPALVAVTVALAGAVLAWGWAGALALPSPRGTTAVLLLGTAALVLSAAFTATEPYLRWVAVALAGSVIASFVHQLLRRDGRPRLVESVASTSMGLGIVASGACFIPVPRTTEGGAVLAAGLAAVAVSALVDLGGRRPSAPGWLVLLGLVLGGIASMLVGEGVGLGRGPMALLGVSCAGVSHAVRLVLAVLPTMAGARPRLVSGAASVLVCGVCVAVVQRLFFAA